MQAIELTGRVDANRRLILDRPLPVKGPSRVKVIVLFESEDEIEESTWLRSASTNPALGFLKEPEEDIYTKADGGPFRDEG